MNMATVEVKVGRLLGDKLLPQISNFIVSQGGYSAEVISYFAEQNGCYAVALDGENIIGTSLNFSAENSGFLRDRLSDYLLSSEISLSKCVSPACIYVDPAYSRQGIGNRMTVLKSRHSLLDGYEYTILWGYESQAIFDYSTRIGRLLDTGVDDQKGFRIYLRRLTDVIDALSGGA